jgi:hypothetical protein
VKWKQRICGCAFEDAIHFILESCLYNEARKELKLRLVFLHELKIEALLFGDSLKNEKKGDTTKKTKYKTKSMKLYNISMFYHTCI